MKVVSGGTGTADCLYPNRCTRANTHTGHCSYVDTILRGRANNALTIIAHFYFDDPFPDLIMTVLLTKVMIIMMYKCVN